MHTIFTFNGALYYKYSGRTNLCKTTTLTRYEGLEPSLGYGGYAGDIAGKVITDTLVYLAVTDTYSLSQLYTLDTSDNITMEGYFNLGITNMRGKAAAKLGSYIYIVGRQSSAEYDNCHGIYRYQNNGALELLANDIASDADRQLVGLVATDNYLFLVDITGLVFRSADGETFTQVADLSTLAGSSYTIGDIESYNNTLYVVRNVRLDSSPYRQAQILTSVDGVSWTDPAYTLDGDYVRDLFIGDNYMYILDSHGSLYRQASPDSIFLASAARTGLFPHTEARKLARVATLANQCDYKATGSYSGGGGSGALKTLGWRPGWVCIKQGGSVIQQFEVMDGASFGIRHIATNGATNPKHDRTVASRMIKIVSNGFRVYASGYTNNVGKGYRYTAIKET